MAVVINEFEVVPETERPAPSEAPPPNQAPPPPPSPHELANALRLQIERMERVWAH